MTHEEEAAVRAYVRISGLVQGVGFRAATQACAQRLGLTGWVRNLPEGDVEAVFEGARDAVEQAIAWCHRGPQRARVRQVHVEWSDATGRYQGFEIRRS
ncbi:MAG TPA: acylphosphatase [Bacillota bacterium]